MKTLNNETVCPICGSPLAQKRVDYIDSFGGQYLIVQEVPVRELRRERASILSRFNRQEDRKTF